MQTPIKALSFVFLAPLRPNDEFDMVVTVREIRTHTFVLGIDGTLVSGTPVFECTLAPDLHLERAPFGRHPRAAARGPHSVPAPRRSE